MQHRIKSYPNTEQMQRWILLLKVQKMHQITRFFVIPLAFISLDVVIL